MNPPVTMMDMITRPKVTMIHPLESIIMRLMLKAKEIVIMTLITPHLKEVTTVMIATKAAVMMMVMTMTLHQETAMPMEAAGMKTTAVADGRKALERKGQVWNTLERKEAKRQNMAIMTMMMSMSAGMTMSILTGMMTRMTRMRMTLWELAKRQLITEGSNM